MKVQFCHRLQVPPGASMKTPRLALLDLCCEHLKPVLTDAGLFSLADDRRCRVAAGVVTNEPGTIVRLPRSIFLSFFPFYWPQCDQ